MKILNRHLILPLAFFSLVNILVGCGKGSSNEAEDYIATVVDASEGDLSIQSVNSDEYKIKSMTLEYTLQGVHVGNLKAKIDYTFRIPGMMNPGIDDIESTIVQPSDAKDSYSFWFTLPVNLALEGALAQADTIPQDKLQTFTFSAAMNSLRQDIPNVKLTQSAKLNSNAPSLFSALNASHVVKSKKGRSYYKTQFETLNKQVSALSRQTSPGKIQFIFHIRAINELTDDMKATYLLTINAETTK